MSIRLLPNSLVVFVRVVYGETSPRNGTAVLTFGSLRKERKPNLDQKKRFFFNLRRDGPPSLLYIYMYTYIQIYICVYTFYFVCLISSNTVAVLGGSDHRIWTSRYSISSTNVLVCGAHSLSFWTSIHFSTVGCERP